MWQWWQPMAAAPTCIASRRMPSETLSATPYFFIQSFDRVNSKPGPGPTFIDTGQTNWIFTLFPYHALGEIQLARPLGSARAIHTSFGHSVVPAQRSARSRVWPRVFATTSSNLALICSTLCAVFVVVSSI